MKRNRYAIGVIGVAAILAWDLAFAQLTVQQCAGSSSGPINHDLSGCSTSTPNEQGLSSCSGSCVTWDGYDTTVYFCAPCSTCTTKYCGVTAGDLTQYKYLDTCGGNTSSGGSGCDCNETDPNASSVDSRVISANITLNTGSDYC
jgi:hypothetical protein